MIIQVLLYIIHACVSLHKKSNDCLNQNKVNPSLAFHQRPNGTATNKGLTPETSFYGCNMTLINFFATKSTISQVTTLQRPAGKILTAPF